MVPASANAGQPAIRALFVPGLAPARVEKCAHWDRASSVVLGGFNGSPAQRTEVRTLWNEQWLFFSFTCSDSAIVSPGGEDGLDHFRLGDTAEVFIARHGAKNYAEIHATPAGRKTVYCCSDYRQPAAPAAAAESIRVSASQIPRGWRAFSAVPRTLFGCAGEGDEYDIFFARYDYAVEGGIPVLSSYPPQRGDKPDFHRRGDYAILRLNP